MAKKKPLKKDRKAGRGNLPAQKQPFYLQAQQQRKPKPKKQREDWDEPAIEPGEYPVSCDRMDEQGSGVVYLEGEKLPVDGLLPGEQAVVEVFGKRNLHARLLQIKKASSKRVKPQCPAFAKCGGCKMQHLQYDSQLEWKQKTVEQLMKRYIDEGAKLYQIVGMVEPWRYRNKCHISFGMNGRRQIISGIYEENSHRVVPVENCLIQDSKADEIARSVRAIMKECKLLPYDEDSETGLLRHLLVRTGFASGQVMVVLVTASPIFPARSRFVSLLRERHPEITTIVMNCNPRKTSMVLGEQERILYGKGYIEDILCEKRFAISPRSFYQVNPQQTEVLYQRAIGMAQLKKGQRVLDEHFGELLIPLAGEHQLKNAANVLCAVEQLAQRGWKIPVEAVREGLAAAKWPARFELLDESPCFILDGGHNPQCVQAAMDALERFFPGKKAVILTGMMQDKDTEKMLEQMAEHAACFVCLHPDSPRALSAEQLAQQVTERFGLPAFCCESIAQGVALAREKAGSDGLVCALGSLYLAAEVRAQFEKE